MRTTIILAICALAITSCHSDSVNESLRVDSNEVIVVNKRLFTEVPVNNEMFCSGGNPATNCAKILSLLHQRLMKINPLPVPDFGQTTTISWQEADIAYRKFLDTYKTDPILNLFQQLYTRILLNQYGIGSSNNFDLIRYYLDQMISSHSLDFATMTETISRLNGHIPVNIYHQMLTSIIKAAEVQQEQNIKTIASIEKSLQTPTGRKVSGNIRPEFFNEADRQLLSKLKSSDLLIHISQLRSLRSGEGQKN